MRKGKGWLTDGQYRKLYKVAKIENGYLRTELSNLSGEYAKLAAEYNKLVKRTQSADDTSKTSEQCTPQVSEYLVKEDGRKAEVTNLPQVIMHDIRAYVLENFDPCWIVLPSRSSNETRFEFVPFKGRSLTDDTVDKFFVEGIDDLYSYGDACAIVTCAFVEEVLDHTDYIQQFYAILDNCKNDFVSPEKINNVAQKFTELSQSIAKTESCGIAKRLRKLSELSFRRTLYKFYELIGM